MQRLRLASHNLLFKRIWQRFLNIGSVEELPKSGCPRKTSAVDDRYIVTMSLRQRFDTARTLNQQFLHATGITIFVNRQSEIVFMTTEFMLGD